MSGFKLYVIKNARIKVWAIQVSEENFEAIEKIYGTRDTHVGFTDGVEELRVWTEDHYTPVAKFGTWICLTDIELDPNLVIDRTDIQYLSDENFTSRFEEYVEAEVVPGSLFDHFKTRLEEHYEFLKASKRLTAETTTEGLFELLSEGLLAAGNEDPKAGLTIALAALLLDDRAEFSPGDLIAAHESGKE